MNIAITAHSVIQFVLSHPKYRLVFPGWTVEQIATYLMNKVRDDELIVVLHDELRISGILTYTLKSPKIACVETILLDSRAAFRSLIQAWQRNFPDFAVRGMNRPRQFNYTIRNFSRILR